MTAIVYLSPFSSHRSQYHNCTAVYIDGSNGSYVSCGVIYENNILNCHLPASFSIFSAVFLAIKIALKLIASYSHSYFIIYSDYYLETLQSAKCSQTFICVLEHYNELTKKEFNILFCCWPTK